jgi:hypothetical protein
MTKLSGIRMDIYRSAKMPDCSNGGISGRVHEVTLILPEGGPFEPTADAPAIILENHVRSALRAVECDEDGERLTGWSMMGGCYVATSDSRFGDECERLLGYRFYGAVPLHDRFEQGRR